MNKHVLFEYHLQVDDILSLLRCGYFSNFHLKNIMQGTGFEPAQALSYWILSPTRLTTPAPPHIKAGRTKKYWRHPASQHQLVKYWCFSQYKKFFKSKENEIL